MNKNEREPVRIDSLKVGDLFQYHDKQTVYQVTPGVVFREVGMESQTSFRAEGDLNKLVLPVSGLNTLANTITKAVQDLKNQNVSQEQIHKLLEQITEQNDPR